MKRSVNGSVVAIACCFASFPPPLARAADAIQTGATQTDATQTGATSAAQRGESWQQHRKLMDTCPLST